MKLVDAQALAILLRVPAATIRSWARRGKLTRQGHDSKGRTLYDINEARQVADTPRKHSDLKPTQDTCNTSKHWTTHA